MTLNEPLTARDRAVVASTPGKSVLTPRAFVYGNTILGRVFTSPPIPLAFGCSVLAIVGLFLPAAWAHVLVAKDQFGNNIGFLQKIGWSLMYPLVLPVLIACASYISTRMFVVA